ncbi:hypothetical protein RO3G_05878 [Rhizopus delemar RA 99-880]|uniref:Uncharacterized protein n=1 Tax=Rhizopus delemar (strain RA 99-880 / ATCC MYA-4621 / FGSC 9543 / NRRL 43880) TaxID=246409 RepID=I1BY93_RHIO9|nr:hypothetical protein RO3G_05878 [Rhizopus delemar RA 99-880]|eukprot:EIE81173.1 hypothetical protein RO3G_05878 [Rhizopus delemar RA 99-880]
MSTATFQHDFEPCLARLGTTPEEVYALDDIETLRQLIIKKERERQAIANDLEVAARIGLVISETNEAIQIKELDQARRELSKFRKEMDGLSAQLNDMASEMVNSKETERF